jgi:hypothetical protein
MKDKLGNIHPATVIEVEYWDPLEKLPEQLENSRHRHNSDIQVLTNDGEIVYYDNLEKTWFIDDEGISWIDAPKLWAYIPELE